MNKTLDASFRRWLDSIADAWSWLPEEVAKSIGGGEVTNRLNGYPLVRSALSTSPFSIEPFADAAREFWVLGGRFDAIRFNAFAKSSSASALVVS
jgi:hypothetical protein